MNSTRVLYANIYSPYAVLLHSSWQIVIALCSIAFNLVRYISKINFLHNAQNNYLVLSLCIFNLRKVKYIASTNTCIAFIKLIPTHFLIFKKKKRYFTYLYIGSPSSSRYHRTRYTFSPRFGGVMSQGSLAEIPSTARCLSTFDEPVKRKVLYCHNYFYLVMN